MNLLKEEIERLVQQYKKEPTRISLQAIMAALSNYFFAELPRGCDDFDVQDILEGLFMPGEGNETSDLERSLEKYNPAGTGRRHKYFLGFFMNLVWIRRNTVLKKNTKSGNTKKTPMILKRPLTEFR